MKVKTQRFYPLETPKFIPFKLEFTIETREEAMAFRNLFNYNPVCRIFDDKTNISGNDVRKVIDHAVPKLGVRDWLDFIKYFK